MKRKKSSIRSTNFIEKKRTIPTIKHARQLIQAFQPIDIVDFGRGRMSKITKNKNQKKNISLLVFYERSTVCTRVRESYVHRGV